MLWRHTPPYIFLVLGFLLCCSFFIHYKALEKNQQWLVYDQQREAYVKGLLAKIFELEKRTETAAASLTQQMKKIESEGTELYKWSFGISLTFPNRSDSSNLDLFLIYIHMCQKVKSHHVF
jgi:hypothetical protein